MLDLHHVQRRGAASRRHLTMAALPYYADQIHCGMHGMQPARRMMTPLPQRRGKKLLVLDPKISAYLGFLTEIALLREHGVER